MKSFIGGIHPPYNKITKKEKIREADIPDRVIIPLMQHCGCPCEALVNVGDRVKKGQKIGDTKEYCSAPVHASVSGTVVEISEKPHPTLGKCEAVAIKNNNMEMWHESVQKRDKVEDLSKQEIVDIVREAGIVGMGGAMFPTHAKLCLPEGKKVDTVILNGAECEPYLTCDHRLMIEKSVEVVKGLKLIMKAVGATRSYIGIESNKFNAISVFDDLIGKEDHINTVQVQTKYPQGAEKLLIYSITGKKVPHGGLPLDVGVVVINVGTAKAVYDAVYEGKPLIERVVTVTGAVGKPANLLVRIGTRFKDLVYQAGDYDGTPGQVINSGPMMGIAQKTDEVPVIKGTSGILVQLRKEVGEEDELPCIRCGKCVDACPMLLVPAMISKSAKNNLIDMADEYHAMDCFECGCCAYVCPSKIPLVERIKYAKQKICEKRGK